MPRSLPTLAGLLTVLTVGASNEAAAQKLGPIAPMPGLAPTDTGRVTVGSEAPDFTLEALIDGPVTLSAFRGTKNVVLVFYRGHW